MIFLIGGKGFVGSAFARTLEARGIDYTIVTRQNYQEYVGKKCETIINANGNSSKILATKNPIQDFDATVRSVRASLVDFKYDHYVYISSCDVYPDYSSPATTSEEGIIDIKKQTPYGFHKYLAEKCVQHAAPNWLIVRFGGFVGPGLKKNAIYDILHGGPLWLNPQSELQFMHVDQAAEATLELINHKKFNEIFNICGRGLIKLQEVIDAVHNNPIIQPQSPLVRYNVNIEKVSKLLKIPETRKTVLEFVKAELKRVRKE